MCGTPRHLGYPSVGPSEGFILRLLCEAPSGAVHLPNSDRWSISPTLGAVPRGDGRLNHDLLPGEKGPQDACGVFGVWAPGEEVAKLTYFGLYALQHRGQESAGIAVSNGSQILVFKDMGLVSQVFDETSLGSLQGHIAVGHARYSTTGASVWENAQPTFRATAHGSIALGHNGNLVNTAQLAKMVAELPKENGRATQVAATNDTDLVTALLAGQVDDDGKPLTIEEAAAKVLPEVRGAFSLVFMDEGTLYAARDPQGIRPLVLGRLERGWVVASESAALDICGASFVREIELGELIAIDENGIRSSASRKRSPRAVCSSTSISRVPTPTSPAGTCISPVWRWAAGSPRKPLSRPTW